MPLLDDMGSVYYGTLPIETMYRAGVEVWPKTPVGLAATATRWDQVTLTITPPLTGADSYTIRRGTTQIYSGPLLTFTDTVRMPSTLYTYTVDAIQDGAVTSSASAFARTPARADMGLTATASNWGTVALAWNDPNPGSGGAAWWYGLYADGSELYWSQDAISSTNHSVGSGTSHSYRLDASREEPPGSDNWVQMPVSDTASTTTSSYPDLGLTAAAASYSQINLSWTAAISPADSFQLWCTSPYSVKIGDYAANATTASHTGLAASTGYSYELSVYRSGVIIKQDQASATTSGRTYSTGSYEDGGMNYYSWTECTEVTLSAPNFNMNVSAHLYDIDMNVSGYSDSGRWNPKIDGTTRGWFTCGSTSSTYPTSYWSHARFGWEGDDGNPGIWLGAGTHSCGAITGGDCNKTQWYAHKDGAYQTTIALGTAYWWYWNSLARDEEMRVAPWWNENLADRAIHVQSWGDTTGTVVAVKVYDRITNELLVEWGTVPPPPPNPPITGGAPPDMATTG